MFRDDRASHGHDSLDGCWIDGQSLTQGQTLAVSFPCLWSAQIARQVYEICCGHSYDQMGKNLRIFLSE
jgi:hypothetical protein